MSQGHETLPAQCIVIIHSVQFVALVKDRPQAMAAQDQRWKTGGWRADLDCSVPATQQEEPFGLGQTKGGDAVQSMQHMEQMHPGHGVVGKRWRHRAVVR
jgi:hypothetical protein